jgi:16S rRNA (cytosine1402-N4)-methyltransferase
MPVRDPSRSRREEGGKGHEQASRHTRTEHAPVMAAEALELLDLHAGEVVVDATYGRGGHSKAIQAAAKVKCVALDADPASAHDGVITANFADLAEVLKSLDVKTINKALFDFGWNITQLASGRGFSFLADEPLVMSYGPKPRSGFTAAEILNTWSEKTIADALFGYGEERYARRIAKAVALRRAAQPYHSTIELVETIKDAVPVAYRRGRLHPATRTFQALRIAVNDELGAIDAGLRAAWRHLAPGGRIVTITFHSVEDRLVKRLFAEFATSGEGRLLVKKPLAADAAEVKLNPPSRSAKMRAIQKN